MCKCSHGWSYVICALYAAWLLPVFYICAMFNTPIAAYYKVWIHQCVSNLSHHSIAAWRNCLAARITRAAPRSTTLAGWVSMTQWRTCWASRGRSASRASPRTRSPPCTLLLSEFNWSLRAGLSIPPSWTTLIWPEFPSKSLKFDQSSASNVTAVDIK